MSNADTAAAVQRQAALVSFEKRNQHMRPDIAGTTAKANDDAPSGILLIDEAELDFNYRVEGFASLRSVERCASMFGVLTWSITTAAKPF